MTDSHAEQDRLDEMRQRARLQEYEFTSAAPVAGRSIAWLRTAWNSVATKWQVRPLMEQQSAFNQALVDWLAHPPGVTGFDSRLVDHDRNLSRTVHDAGTLATRAANRRGLSLARRPRLAYFSPMPPARSGIADYSAKLLPYLADLADITVFADDPGRIQSMGLPTKQVSEFPHVRHEYDLPLYQMGNSDHHERLYDMLVRHPGVVVLHDYFIHHFMIHHTAVAGDWMAYARELNYELGGGGRLLARSIRLGQSPAPLFELPMNRRIIDTALGLIVHSQYAADRIARARLDVPLAVIPHFVDLRPGVSRRDQLAIPDGAALFASIGYITPEKQIDVALRAFRRLLAAHPDSYYLLVGEAHPSIEVAAIVEELELGDRVHHVGYAEDLDTLVDWIHTADIVVNLRHPTVGETSGIVLRALAAARPLIVYDDGWYAELSPDAVLKVAPGDENSLVFAMTQLATSSTLRRSMGQSGYEYVLAHCLPEQIAASYLNFIRLVMERNGQ